MLKIDDGTSNRTIASVGELKQLIEQTSVDSLGMTTPDNRLWHLYQVGQAGKDSCYIACLGVGTGIDRPIESIEDIADFLDSVPMSGLILQMCHKVFDINFLGFVNE